MMDRDLAKEIVDIRLQERKMLERKFEIMKRLHMLMWDDVTNAAMQFLIEEGADVHS